MKEKDILHENGDYWVAKIKNLCYVMKAGITHSESIACFTLWDMDKAIAYCDYKATR